MSLADGKWLSLTLTVKRRLNAASKAPADIRRALDVVHVLVDYTHTPSILVQVFVMF